jgi:hypothetical protein
VFVKCSVRRQTVILALATALTLPLLTTITPVTSQAAAPIAPKVVLDMTPWVHPTMPPTCTDAQANSGAVAGCRLAGDGSLPGDRGFGTPPFPAATVGATLPWVDLTIGATGHVVVAVQTALNAAGQTLSADGDFGPLTAAAVTAYQLASSLPSTGIVDAATAAKLGVTNTVAGVFPPPGFVWSGWGYNGSPALADWESKMVRNPVPWGKVGAQRVQGNPEVMDLYAGFVSEISLNGYVINDIGSYVFRCTASTRKDCRELGPGSLSNHAWGLAMDINTSANPMYTYVAPPSTGTACSVSVNTDMPKWVVDTAQRWGLYWGGYAWSSGCTSPSDTKTATTRDPMHFEFNGSLAQARAIVARNLGARACSSVISDAGAVRNACTESLVPLAGWRIPVDVKAPAGATAALVNITLTEATTSGFVTAESCGPVAQPARQWSNGNFSVGKVVANLSVVPLDANGKFCLYTSAGVQEVVDVQGFFVPATQPGAAGFVSIDQQRVLDTRTADIRLPGGAASPLPSLGNIPAGATAVLMNATVVGALAPGFLTADSCARLNAAGPTSSNVNFAASSVVANLAVVPQVGGATPPSACMWPSASTHLVVDTQGAFVPDTGLGFSLVVPTRLIDTRGCVDRDGAQVCNTRVGDGQMLRVTGAHGVAALVNLTLTDTVGEMFAVADRCDVLATARPLRSNSNSGIGRTVANLAIVPLEADGSFCVWVSRATHVVVDIQGVFEPQGALRFVAQTPTRRLDTRNI